MDNSQSADRHTRRDDARAKAARLQEQAAAAERRRRALIAGVAVLVVAPLAIATTLFIRGNQDEPAPTASPTFGPQGAIALPAPEGAAATQPGAVTVRTSFDYMCPYCRQFEEATATWQESEAKAGRLTQELVPLGLLDRYSQGSQFSTRSASAAYCVASADTAKVHDFTTAMFNRQPAERTTGLTNQQLRDIAGQVLPGNSAVATCVSDAAHRSYVAAISDQASKDGIGSTPTVTVNGKPVKLTTVPNFLTDLQTAVAAAR